MIQGEIRAEGTTNSTATLPEKRTTDGTDDTDKEVQILERIREILVEPLQEVSL